MQDGWTTYNTMHAKHCLAEERAGPSAGRCFCREKGATSELLSFIRRTSCRAGRTQHLRFEPGIGAFAVNGVRHLFHGEASRGKLRDNAQAAATSAARARREFDEQSFAGIGLTRACAVQWSDTKLNEGRSLDFGGFRRSKDRA